MPDTPSPIAIAPRGTTWPGTLVYSGGEIGTTRQAYWYRLRAQREYGRRHEAACYWLRLSWYDDAGRLWQHGTVAVVDDFGTLVEAPESPL